ncbi:MAG: tetratricopeptide repeat protein [Balneolaceae bacterium]|nr:MAG: tetratricopeptide repeat protein [Balneolaceae bacterium]
MKSTKLYISLCLALFMALGLAEITNAQDEARAEAVELYNEAQELATNNQFSDAISIYREALSISREHAGLNDITDLIEERLPRVYASRAINEFRTFQNDRNISTLTNTIEYFKTARTAADEFGDAQVAQQATNNIPQLYFQRGVLNFRAENFDAAMADLDEAIELNPNYAAAFYQKGIVQKQIDPEDLEAFQYWYDRAIEIAENVNDTRTLNAARNGMRDELIFRAVTIAEQRQFNRAIELLNKVENYDPASYEAHFRLSEIHNERGNWSSAESAARRSLELHTGGTADKAKMYFELGTALKGQGRVEEACSAFENARFGSFTDPANHELQFELRCEGHTPR